MAWRGGVVSVMVLGLVGGAAMQRRGPKSDIRGAGAV